MASAHDTCKCMSKHCLERGRNINKCYKSDDKCQQKEAELIEQGKICDQLKVKSITSRTKIELLKSTISTLEESLVAKAATVSANDTEPEVKTKALQQKECTISRMKEQLATTMEFLTIKRQVSFVIIISGLFSCY